MIRIDKINWLSIDAKEAEVHLSDGNFTIIGFSHPFNQTIGDRISLPIYTLNAREIYRVNEEKKISIEKRNTGFEYKLTGLVIDKNNNQVKIGEFIIKLDNPFPYDIQENDYVSFICDRIDIW